MKKIIAIVGAAMLLTTPVMAGNNKSLDVKTKTTTNKAEAFSGGNVSLLGATGSGSALAGISATGGVQTVNSTGAAKASAKDGNVKTSHNGSVTSGGFNASGALGGAVGATGYVVGGGSVNEAAASTKVKTSTLSVKKHN